ncbi:hypothetical protein N9N28_12860 [Rubripirellula amarantea]|nr:hypothetical protein [Rubripirellula amarantea]
MYRVIRQQAVGSGQRATGNKQQATSNKQQATSNRQWVRKRKQGYIGKTTGDDRYFNSTETQPVPVRLASNSKPHKRKFIAT